MNQNADSADQQPIKYKVMKVEKCAVFWAVAGILLYFADIISDISLAMNYYYNGHIKFFGLTIFLVILSAVVSSLFSLYMYWIDSKKNEELKVPKKDWIVRTIFLVLGIAPVLRNVDSLCFALKSYESRDENIKQYYARRMVFEINDGSFLRLFEAFIETGPQLILQLYIFVEMQPLSPNIFTITEIWQCCTMLISAISISGCIVSYTNSLRNSLDKKNDLRWFLLPPLFLWRFFEVISRVIAMGLAISASPYFHIAFVVHFIIMTIWVYFLKTDFCDDRCAEKIYNVLLGVILTFVFLNPEDSPTKKRCIIFYVGMFVENTFLMVFWFYNFSCTPDHVPAMIIQVSSFFLGIMFMIIYYEFFHPTVGKLYMKRAKECNNLKSYSETEMQNGEASAMLEMVKNAQITESVLQNMEANAMLETIQNDETVETRKCSF